MADLTLVVEVLAAHRLVVNRSEQRPWCSCGWHGRPATDDHLAHQAQALVDAGLVATETEWGVRRANGQLLAPMSEAETQAWKSGTPIRREVTPWQLVTEEEKP